METSIRLERLQSVKVRSYRTYEEWKLDLCQELCVTRFLVLTVPMRNGNFGFSGEPGGCNLVLTVPMRNGNLFIFSGAGRRDLFLPYLWGMETPPLLLLSSPCFGSYRTYEEWKQGGKITWWERIYVLTVPMRNGNFNKISKVTICKGTFLPYLWGMETRPVPRTVCNSFPCSYRTYEEWKPAVDGKVQSGNAWFLPYLWGMETSSLRNK